MRCSYVNSKFFDAKIVIIYCMIFTVFLFSAYGFNQAVATLSEDMVQNHTVIIDAGHGGVDGGAVSCTGI